MWVGGLHIDWFHHKEEGNTNLLCRILKVQQGLRGALEEESQLVLLGGCLPLALRRWCSVKHFGKHSGTRRQHSLQGSEKERDLQSDCRSRMMMLRRLRSDLIPAHAHTQRDTRTLAPTLTAQTGSRVSPTRKVTSHSSGMEARNFMSSASPVLFSNVDRSGSASAMPSSIKASGIWVYCNERRQLTFQASIAKANKARRSCKGLPGGGAGRS